MARHRLRTRTLRAPRRERETGNRERRAESGAAHGAAPAAHTGPEGAVSRGVERFAEQLVSGRLATTEFPNGIRVRLRPAVYACRASRNGCSNASLTHRRKRAPSAPSIAR